MWNAVPCVLSPDNLDGGMNVKEWTCKVKEGSVRFHPNTKTDIP